MQEDSKMIAFFDSLIQGDIEGWHSHSDDSVASDTDSNFCLEVDGVEYTFVVLCELCFTGIFSMEEYALW